jgi:predicted MFS family arabinose efflux permease
MEDSSSASPGYSEALASSEFRALLSAQFVAVSGMSIAAVALTVLVYRRTHSPLLASMTFALSFVPYLFGGALLSGVVDRVRPRRLVSSCDACCALLVAAIASPGLPLPLLFALLFASGSLSSISSGGRAALTRATVSQRAYVPARSLLRIAAQLAQIGGNAGGGALLLVISPRGAVLVNAATYVFSSLTTRFGIRDHPNAGQRGDGQLLRSSLRGARTILGHAELRRLLLFAWLAPTFTVVAEAVAAPYVSAHHGSSSLVGWWLIALPIGLICGDIAGVRLLSPGQQRRLVGPAAALGFVPYLVFVVNPAIGPAIALLALSGMGGVYALGLDARIRDTAPPHLFARTMTLNQSGMMALQGIGFALGGAIAQLIGPASAIAVAGGCGVTVTLTLLRQDFARLRMWSTRLTARS